MEFNKCERCGAFFVSSNNVCPKCMPKDTMELSKLKNFLEENNCPSSLESLSFDTGISTKNLDRFIKENDFSKFNLNFNNSSIKL